MTPPTLILLILAALAVALTLVLCVLAAEVIARRPLPSRPHYTRKAQP